MGSKLSSIALKDRMIYRADFDTIPTDEGSDQHEIYTEVILYDGGGVEGYGDSTKDN
jgi:hypothetical protein